MVQDMQRDFTMKKLAIVIYIVLLFVGWFGVFKYKNKYNSIVNAPTITDTITVRDTVTITELVPIEVIKVKKVVEDTLTSKKDSTLVPVLLPLEEKVYGDSTFRAVISGYKVNLDTLALFPTTTTITEKKLIRTKEKGFKLRPSIGVGYGLINRKPDLWIGISLTYNF